MFRKLLLKIPLSANASARAKQAFKIAIQPWLDEIQVNKYSLTERLYGRIIYFNHERTNVRDIHNIFKPTLDLLNDIVYEDDQSILFFEGIRLDMVKSGLWFEVYIDTDMEVIDLSPIFNQTCLLIEVGTLPLTSPNIVSIQWI